MISVRVLISVKGFWVNWNPYHWSLHLICVEGFCVQHPSSIRLFVWLSIYLFSNPFDSCCPELFLGYFDYLLMLLLLIGVPLDGLYIYSPPLLIIFVALDWILLLSLFVSSLCLLLIRCRLVIIAHHTAAHVRSCYCSLSCSLLLIICFFGCHWFLTVIAIANPLLMSMSMVLLLSIGF